MTSTRARRRRLPCYVALDDAPAKQKILTSALRLFVKDGLCETSIRDIASASGYTNPALFKHFNSKEDLALHLFEQCYRMLFDAIAQAIAGRASFTDQQRAAIAAYLAMLDADRDAVIYVQDNLRQFWPRMPASVRRTSIVALVRAMLERGRDERVVATDAPIELMVVGWLGVLQQFGRAWWFGQFAGAATRHAAGLERVLSRMVHEGSR